MRIDKINLQEAGTNRFFGSLEARIMDALWSRPSCEATIRDVQEQLDADGPISFNAVMTVMNRLVEKGHLQKAARGRTSMFRTTLTQDQFVSEQTKQAAYGLVEQFGGLAIAHFLDAIEQLQPELLQELETKLLKLKNKIES
ncbi:BlaI/MecI/CopY family transcriptional regulator [Paenibacillus athensensis]|uniref:Transcriptional regulator n=1 Tax=Paenibacillus athensensis TaxID=1967502 RepID=A0A4Y8Q2E3_9BACL|nr:BlaI/MecI/CopY family transcriptional regulator [Paenibacillus athensensis]MCD1260621.1 BlaI/MecI/CopY family transcriptional regulator [Paenibacillus athensensis]